MIGQLNPVDDVSPNRLARIWSISREIPEVFGQSEIILEDELE